MKINETKPNKHEGKIKEKCFPSAPGEMQKAALIKRMSKKE